MRISRFPVVVALALSMAVPDAFAQTQPHSQTFEPQVGQAGKDVIWVPTPQVLVNMMLDMANLTPADYVIDLGSGDGRTVITAAKRGAHALGIEYNPSMVELSKQNAATEGVSDRAEFMNADLFEADFSKATVVTMFLLPSINLRLRPKLLGLKPGTRIVSNTFTMGEWTPDAEGKATDGCSVYCNALLWIVPAKVEGTWRLGQDSIELHQEFQNVSGTLTAQGIKTPVAGRVHGDQIELTAGTGQVHGPGHRRFHDRHARIGRVMECDARRAVGR